MDYKLLLIAGGIFHLGFAVFHLFFWRIFHWKKDLASITTINRNIMQILNLCLTLVFMITAYISILYSDELLSSNLGHILLISISLFWLIRTIEQVVFFGLKKRLSVILTLLFILGFVIYLIPVVSVSL